MLASPEFLIEGILPAHEVHLLGGSSGSGKTTLVFQTLAAWQEGRSVFGHNSHPVPYSYISLDRSRSSVNRTLERLGLDGVITRLICQEDLPENCVTVAQVVTESQEIHLDSRLFVIEGFQLLAGDRGNSYTPVASLLKRSARICTAQALTILGICHSPKMKVDESFQHPREFLMGSTAWGAYSDTVVTVNLDEAKGIITVRILPRNEASEEHDYIFGSRGVLEPATVGSPRDTLRIRIAALPVGATLMTADIMDLGKKVGAKETTVKRVIRDCLANKVLARVEEGMYTRTTRSPLTVVQKDEFIVDV